MTIPDSDAQRARRYRLHKAGDHSECRNCAAKRGAAAGMILVPETPALAFDAAEALKALAARLEAAHVAYPADAAVARELRMTIQTLMGAGSGRGSDDDLAELFGAFGSA